MTFLRFPNHRYWRVPAALALSAVLVGAVWLWYSGSLGSTAKPGGRPGGKLVAVQALPVERITLRDVRVFPGTLNANSAFDVAPKIGGRLNRLNVDVGDKVKKGQVVARLDDAEQIQLVHQARAEIGVASAALAEARSLLVARQRQFERSKRLFQQSIGSEADLEAARAEAEAQEARVQVAKAQVGQRKALLRAAEIRLSYTVMRANWNGAAAPRVVGQRYASEGEMLAANKPILSVLEIGSLIAVVHATESDYARLKPGQPVLVAADAFPGRKFSGSVARLAPQFEQSSRQARMEVTVPNLGELLKPGMYVRVEVEVARAKNAMVVPAESVVSRAGRKGVFMVDREKEVARFVPVRTGLTQGDRIQIIEPVLDGLVARLGQHLLRDGATVRLAGANTGATSAPREGGGRAKEGKKP